MATIPTRIDQDIFDAAKSAGALHSRSATQQLDHWARIGRAFEASPSVTHDAVSRVLAGEANYDSLPSDAQAVVRAHWDEQLTDDVASLDLAGSLRASGKTYSTADADGNVIIHGAEPASA